MKNIKLILLFVIPFFSFVACEDSDDINEIFDDPLTEEEIVEGLKEALVVSTDTSVKIVSAVDGYYGDSIIKILLPPEAQVIQEAANDPLFSGLGLDQLVEDAILSMNRAAEDAATEATPIFINSITTMTIQDAYEILEGSDTAATHYLRTSTSEKLRLLFQPKIDNSLDKELILETSTNDLWDQTTSLYNGVAELVPGWETVDVDLSEYVTVKALDGLFIKVAEEEADIRNDPLARVTELLKEVFGGN